MDIFLKAKHWHIFSLMMIVPAVLQFLFLANFGLDMMLTFLPIISVLFILVFFGWFWAVGTRLNNKLPAEIKINLILFKVLLIVPILYTLAISFYISLVAQGMIENARQPIFALNDLMPRIFPLHIFSVFCMFYAMWFIAKTVKAIELQRDVSFSDFIGDFFLIWLFPIGIWIIQPKINKVSKEK